MSGILDPGPNSTYQLLTKKMVTWLYLVKQGLQDSLTSTDCWNDFANQPHLALKPSLSRLETAILIKLSPGMTQQSGKEQTNPIRTSGSMKPYASAYQTRNQLHPCNVPCKLPS
ncbi:hypothetical protein IV203_020152 [Nitzschia inconspicua]|uniref:Uncharacterized protein n=1 Tax=Nitzschia inconspicua TaxID=303405 RepID=A0A9K3K9C9_9STRA|nr:hypothetical protein IV203_020342 [Nitzschia inconspicua]KAG7371582.1 hypothetical protein IV203_020152 [Nitzschia inconspicua]